MEDTWIEDTSQQLRAKIASKFQVSTVLAGFAAAILSIELTLLWDPNDPPNLLFLSVPALVAALILFVSAIVRLDGLTLPKRFWDPEGAAKLSSEKGAATETRKALRGHGRLAAADLDGMHERMIFYWYRLTMAATYLSALALACLLVPESLLCDRLEWSSLCQVGDVRGETAIFTLAAIAIAGLYLLAVRGKRFTQELVQSAD